MKLLSRPLRRRPRTPTRPVPTHCTLQAVCDPRVEGKVRALCVLAFAGTGVRVRSLHTIEPDDSDSAYVLVQVTLAADDRATAALERLVVQLAREPRIRDLQWHLHSGRTALAAPLPS
ncbi:hypothetical protein [Streptomyces sp. NPDC001404]|uniref:hypothetical protein n=1 Tax=Streptomyces sp. NPDC001404 TaxID=3364571 RepID=UPI003685C241